MATAGSWAMSLEEHAAVNSVRELSRDQVQRDGNQSAQPSAGQTYQAGHALSTPLSTNDSGDASKPNSTSYTTLAVLAAVVVSLFCVFVRYDGEAQTDQHVQQFYMWYIHVAIMVFVGFGFLMTFLRQYSLSAVGLNFLASCFVIIEAVLFIGFAQQQLWGSIRRYTVKLDLPLLIDATFCAASSMISFGAVLGKTTPAQLLCLLALHVPMYAVNQQLVLGTLGVLDIGGSITIHVFGAYYGLAASIMLGKRGMGSSHSLNRPSYLTDVTSMVGTLFLWIYWPSFNGALASDPTNPHSPQQFNCVLNTVLSLCGACVAAFGVSSCVCGKFDMMHIQNATLAGGVAIGSAANLAVAPGFALVVGLLAGTLSTLGFTHVMPWLESRIGLSDTCGVHNLHGMPGLLAAAVAAVACAWSYDSYSQLLTWGRLQPGYEIAGAIVTLAVALSWGALAGLLVNRAVGQKLEAKDAFTDLPLWKGLELRNFTALGHGRSDITHARDGGSREGSVRGGGNAWDTKVQWTVVEAMERGYEGRPRSMEAGQVAMGRLCDSVPLWRPSVDARVSHPGGISGSPGHSRMLQGALGGLPPWGAADGASPGGRPPKAPATRHLSLMSSRKLTGLGPLVPEVAASAEVPQELPHADVDMNVLYDMHPLGAYELSGTGGGMRALNGGDGEICPVRSSAGAVHETHALNGAAGMLGVIEPGAEGGEIKASRPEGSAQPPLTALQQSLQEIMAAESAAK